ncbi:MAG: hypothetical protein WBS24_04185 [Terriglobales bacterium]
MTTPPIDYASILADLEAKKAALEAIIASVRGAMAVGSLGQPGDGNGYIPSGLPTSMNGGEVPAGAFFAKSIPDAAKVYLEIVKKKQTSKEIAAALLQGGMESASKNFPSIVHSILDRARKGANPAFVKLGTQWGLASWYPNLVASTTKPGGKKTKQVKAAKKKAAAKPAKTQPASRTPKSAPSGETKKNEPGTTTTKVMEAMRSKPGNEFTLHDIAKASGLELKKVNLVMGNLQRGGKVEKTSGGKYRAAA